ncbi:hypothetical protein [Pararhizobium antarcticum]|uniref:Uncharacterized protein n=1 Tax=Pararhizobium antarcticum TaxID=1798805 RepID=A0A657LU11_9HYPH|nr:hypothetical protein [Pararhizobium antarcticum]OJF97408.1 hypothetical protein AX760_16935 [Pararhizobium antarcticum]
MRMDIVARRAESSSAISIFGINMGFSGQVCLISTTGHQTLTSWRKLLLARLTRRPNAKSPSTNLANGLVFVALTGRIYKFDFVAGA